MAAKLLFRDELRFAREMDQLDPLRSFRKEFYFPKYDGKNGIYLVGNSLGLQPRNTKNFVNQELEDWGALGVEGHLHARRPWAFYHRASKKSLARLVGANPSEVVAMNQLTVNLHLLMVSFYRPKKRRYKILTEAGAFSSDQYAFETQIKFHGLDPADALIELKPRDGEHVLRTEDIVAAINTNADSLALVIFGGVQYYTGQFFDLKIITSAAHNAGAIAGFDLAHAIGNTPLKLHDQGVDFAVWCSYKYLNAGPGGIAGAFVHERHAADASLPRFGGWWGHDEEERFQMKKGFKPMDGIDGWQTSNVPVFQAAALLASLSLFDRAGFTRLRKKSIQLTGYLEFLLNQIDPEQDLFSIITPMNAEERGCQLSLKMKSNGKDVFKKISKKGIFADWREPAVIRVAPVPLYNTFEDVFRFSRILKEVL